MFSIRLLHLQITMVASGGEVWRNINNNPCISFHPVQTQVNKNVFNFQLHDCKQLVKRTVIALKDQNLKNALKIFVENVEESLNRLTQSSIELCGEQSLRKMLLRSFTADTLFHSIFISIFGASEGVKRFNKLFVLQYEYYRKTEYNKKTDDIFIAQISLKNHMHQRR